MVLIPIMRPTLKHDNIKLEANFFNGYRDDDHVFYISAIDSNGDFQFVNNNVYACWSPNWTKANAMFESQLDSDTSFTSYKNKILFIWNNNHRFFV